ncbi:GTP-binding protein [Methyloterricola oryzae]|nr:GTP-binding protein [Methyloterricola oryzae]
MLPVTVLCGIRGSGKTTLLNRLLQSTPHQAALRLEDRMS